MLKIIYQNSENDADAYWNRMGKLIAIKSYNEIYDNRVRQTTNAHSIN